MVLKTIGTYNATWMMAVIEAERRAKATGRRQAVIHHAGYPTIYASRKEKPSERK